MVSFFIWCHGENLTATGQKPGIASRFFCSSDAHQLFFLRSKFFFGDNAGIQKILVLLNLRYGIHRLSGGDCRSGCYRLTGSGELASD